MPQHRGMLRSWLVCPDTSEFLLGPKTPNWCVRNCDKLGVRDTAGKLPGPKPGLGWAEVGIVSSAPCPRHGGHGCTHCPGHCSACDKLVACRFYKISDLLEISGFRSFTWKPHQDAGSGRPIHSRAFKGLRLNGARKAFLSQNIFQAKRTDSEKVKFCEFISIP